ncbi:MAG: NAD(P)-dependent alcohol dehydrogenase [Candidatus Hodarchaeales archaeon]
MEKRDQMHAIVCTKYGSPDVLEYKEVDKPIPKDNEVLIRIYATSLNAADLEYLRGIFFARIRKPRKPFKILGSDIAGRIDAVGSNVKQFRPGDEIFVDSSKYGFGAFAEYACVPEKALMRKPPSMTFEEAATYPQAAVLALQGLRDKKQVQPGQKVLINGAGGGVGTFAIQIAKYFGAEVTGVDNTEKLDFVRSIGADHIIDYTTTDFTKNKQRYDLILDVVANRSIFDYRRTLTPNGTFLAVGGSTARIFQAILLGSLISKFGRKKLGIVMWKPNNKANLDLLTELFEAKKVVPVIDKRYPLSEVPEALRYLDTGQVKGKVVITVEH